MRIAELPYTVSTVKGHWNPSFRPGSSPRDGWVGFTPAKDNLTSRQGLRSTVNRQIGHGAVLEYVSISLPPPNADSRPLEAEEKAMHAEAAGALTAVLKLANTPVHARHVVGHEEYEDLQNRWDLRGDRMRWSEAYPIIEAWNIVDWPKARDVLGRESAGRCCETQSRMLKILLDEDRGKIADLKLIPIDMPPDGLAAGHFISRSQLENKERGDRPDSLTKEDRLLYQDYGSIEGATKEIRVRLAQRDRALVRALKRAGPLRCMGCGYDPIGRGASQPQARAILEAHHKVPICAGERLSRLEDLILLCPTCHREIHQGIVAV